MRRVLGSRPSHRWTTPSLSHFGAIRTSSRLAAERRNSPRLSPYDLSEQTHIATGVSEIVGNAFRYTGHGIVDCVIDGEHGRSG
jgi:anti-sigma regulatory factor (Ser/Thr protein kinase)